MADEDSRSYVEDQGGDSSRMSEQEMEQRSGESPSGDSVKSTSALLDIHKGRPVRVQVRVLVPVKDHPNFNFVGKLLGPKGNSLKRLQEETQTKMAILGRGSMRDKAKEEELRSLGDPKHNHLNEDLHVEITSFAPPAEAYGRLAHALTEVKRFLVPDYYDDIRQNQLRELAILNGDRKKGKTGNGAESGGSDHYTLMDSEDEPPSPPPGPPQIPGATRAISYVGGRGPLKNAVAPQTRPGGPRTFVGQAPRIAAAFRKEGRVHYITEDETYTFEDAKQFPRLRTGAFLEYDESEEDVYDGNGYGPKDFVGEEWVPSSRGINRLKGRGIGRPVVYREHPYFPPSVGRY